LGTPTTNPQVSDGLGNVIVYAAPGTYKFTVTGQGVSTTGQPFTATVAGSGGGNVISGGNNIMTGQNSIAAYNINNVLYLDGNLYPCSVTGINSAVTALPAAGGTIDGRGCQGVQTFSADLTLNSATKAVTLLLGDATWSGTNVVVTVGGIGNKIIGEMQARTKLSFTNTTKDGVICCPTTGGIAGLTIDMNSTGTGAGIHVTSAETSFISTDDRSVRVQNVGAGANASVFLDPGSNTCERIDIPSLVTNGGPKGWWNRSTVNNKSCPLIKGGHGEFNNATGAGYVSQGFNSNTCNNDVTWQVLRTNGNGGDGGDFIQECNQIIQDYETEGNTGVSYNVDANSQNIFVMNLNVSLNVGGNTPTFTAGTINDFYWGLNLNPTWINNTNIMSGVRCGLVTKSAPYTLLYTDCIVNVTGNTTITVPHAGTGSRWTLFNSGAGTLTIQPDAGTINGAASITRAANLGVEVYCDGTNCFAH
jgi:hypothetical protein